MTTPAKVPFNATPAAAEVSRTTGCGTDLDNAQRFVRLLGPVMRFCPSLGWLLNLDGKCWRPDEVSAITQLARDVASNLWAEGLAMPDGSDARKATLKAAQKAEDARRIRAFIELASTWPEIAVLEDSFDADPWVLNCQNGLLNLRTHELQACDRTALCRRITRAEYHPKAGCPRFETFLDRIMLGRAPLVEFLQRWFGYCLTGSTREQRFALFLGSGSNGKTTLVEAMQFVLGNYGLAAEFSTFIQQDRAGIRSDIADLAGPRLVAAVEGAEGARLNEPLIKSLTGGDTIAARRLYHEHFRFKAAAKLILSTNHKPRVRGTDDGIWRRVVLVPFEASIPDEEKDLNLPSKLQEEAAGILAWAVEGCRLWQRDGLALPDEVRSATGRYRSDSDPLGQFIDEQCTVDEVLAVSSKDLYAAFRAWSEQTGEFQLSQRIFAQRLQERGFEPWRTRHERRWKGLALVSPIESVGSRVTGDAW